MTALRLERLRRFRLFGESWSGDKLAAFSESTHWSSFPYFTWVLSPALEWSSAHTKKKKKKAAEQKILACDTMLLDLQKKKKQTGFAYNLTKNKTEHIIITGAQQTTARSERLWDLFFFPSRNEMSSSLSSCHSSVSLCFSDIIQMSFCIAVWSCVYWPKPQCEIQNNCSPRLPWHSLAHCAGLLSLQAWKSNWDRIFQK